MTIETLIELYDERPLENVLGAEMFQPVRVVYICPQNAAQDKELHRTLRSFFSHRGIKTELIFYKADIYNTASILELLRNITGRYPGCVLDITGGTDAVLFAAGMLSSENPLPVFTYSRRKNSFYSIKNAPFADSVPCPLSYKVEDFFLMAGGSVRKGRVDNAILENYLQFFDPFFRVYMENRREWDRIVTYIQRQSPTQPDGTYSLSASGPYSVKGPRSTRIDAPETALCSLSDIGLISDLEISPERVSFRFLDAAVRSWLRDVGSVLELYVYKACLESGLFKDVHTSVVVEWEGSQKENSVSNELDVMCSKGVVPLFISCKTCDVRTEALNELAILKDRFGGNMAKAAIVTAERVKTVTRNRAAELGISIIDLNDLKRDHLQERLRACIL